MMKRIFLDTNVLIDLICCRKPFVQEAERIFVMGDMKKISIGISALSFINTVYIAGKYHFNVPSLRAVLMAFTEHQSNSTEEPMR